MFFLDIVPQSFFSLLSSKHRSLYVESLFVLRKATKQVSNLTRHDFVNRLIIILEQKIINENFDDDNESSDVDLKGISERAHFIVRKLAEYGWIEFDFSAKNKLAESIAIPDYSTQFINFLYSFNEEFSQIDEYTSEVKDYNAMVYNIYSCLKTADTDQQDYFDALSSALKETEKISDVLAGLNYGIQSLQRKIFGNKEINNVLKLHFEDYAKRLHDRFYHPLKTIDSLQRYRSPIVKILRKWLQDSTLRNTIIDDVKNKLTNKNEEIAIKFVISKINYIIESFEQFDTNMEEIDYKISEYTKNAVDKMRYLTNVDNSNKGKINKIISILANKNSTVRDEFAEDISEKLSLYSHDYLSSDSLYNRRNVPDQVDLPPITIIDEEITINDSEILSAFKSNFSFDKVKKYFNNLMQKRKELSICDLPIDSDEQLIFIMLGLIRSDEDSFGYDFNIENEYIVSNRYRIPKITIQRKGDLKNV